LGGEGGALGVRCGSLGIAAQVLFGGEEAGVGEVEGGHEGGVDLGGGDGGALELLVAGGAGVVDDDASVTQVAGGPGGGVDAHMTHCSADDDLLDSVAVQN